MRDPIELDASRLAELKTMKFRATALLATVTVIFVAAKIYERVYPWLGFIRATAEAAMVGGIADWFAVTALFRYPLGLKIPHTAIVPTRKDEIGHYLGVFVQGNFLVEEVISQKLQAMDVARQFARWASRPENSQRVAEHLTVGLAAVVRTMDDRDVEQLIERNVVARVRSTRFAPLAASLLGLLTSGDRHQELLTATLRLTAHLLKENRQLVREQIRRETPRWFPKAADYVIYHWLVRVVNDTLQEVRTNPNHPLHQKFCDLVDQLIDNLKSSPDIEAREAAFKEELLQHPVVKEFSSSLWLDLKEALLNHAPATESDIQQTIQHGLMRFGKTLLQDDLLLAKINRWIEEIVNYFIDAYGHEMAHLIEHTIGQWDAQQATQKIESYVGKDLQYIRINGTIVGGMIGLVIYSLSLLL